MMILVSQPGVGGPHETLTIDFPDVIDGEQSLAAFFSVHEPSLRARGAEVSGERVCVVMGNLPTSRCSTLP